MLFINQNYYIISQDVQLKIAMHLDVFFNSTVNYTRLLSTLKAISESNKFILSQLIGP